jgi:hypothetical protein
MTKMTTWFALAVAAVVAVLARPAWADDDDARLRALARVERGEPSVREAVAAALRHAGLADHPERGLRRRARIAGALPTLTLRASRDTDWNESEAGARVVGEVEQREVYEARATWRLDRLVFDASELRIASLAQQRARARAALTAQVTALYYKRRAAQMDLLWRPPDTIEEQVRRELIIEELTAQLDALTGGWWLAH